jgi:hypothetical protein
MVPMADGVDARFPPFRLAPFDVDQFVQLDGDLQGYRVEFLRGPAGRVAWMRFGGRLFKRAPARKAASR